MADRKDLTTGKISSVRNSKIKNFLHLQKARERKKQNLFVIEGMRETAMACQAGIRFTDVFYCPDILPEEKFLDFMHDHKLEAEVYEVSKDVYRQIAYRKDSEGITGWAVPVYQDLRNWIPGPAPLYLILDRIEKPGNLGGILRTADAAGIDGVLVCDPGVDLYNPNVIRSSLGALFTVPIVLEEAEKVVAWLKNQGITLFCSTLKSSVPYTEADYMVPAAIVMGSEAWGVRRIWEEQASERIIIPMKGQVDSMNVSVSTAIVLFEAVRQRRQIS